MGMKLSCDVDDAEQNCTGKYDCATAGDREVEGCVQADTIANDRKDAGPDEHAAQLSGNQ